MPDEVKTNTKEVIISTLADANKRKKINRIKTLIIVIIIVLFLIPTLLCIILGIQLSRLQKQVDNMFSTYSSNTELKEKNKNSGQYAYASEIDKDVLEDIINADTDSLSKYDNHNQTGNQLDESGNDTDSAGADAAHNDNSINNDNSTNDINNEINPDTNNSSDKENSSDEENSSSEEKSSDEENLSSDEDLIYKDKKVYLTFDDGPTKYTDMILDILAQYEVKATFFVVGHDDEVSKDSYKRIVNEGHTLAMHSYSHNYKEIYKSIEDFDKDFTKLWKLLYDTTGYIPTLYRFPGGSLNFMGKDKIKKFITYLNEKGMTYYDWNVVNGDAEGIDYTEEQMIDNVLNGVAGKRTSIVLMHDGEGKSKTVNTLPTILEDLISGGAEVLPMDDNVPLIQQIKVTSVK